MVYLKGLIGMAIQKTSMRNPSGLVFPRVVPDSLSRGDSHYARNCLDGRGGSEVESLETAFDAYYTTLG
jgi:hypothetical protein